jgi:hypothetical protein
MYILGSKMASVSGPIRFYFFVKKKKSITVGHCLLAAKFHYDK